MLCIAALRALQHNRLLFVGIFALSGGEPFNHEGVTLFTHHGCLPSKFLCDSFRRRRVLFYPQEYPTTSLIGNWETV